MILLLHLHLVSKFNNITSSFLYQATSKEWYVGYSLTSQYLNDMEICNKESEGRNEHQMSECSTDKTNGEHNEKNA